MGFGRGRASLRFDGQSEMNRKHQYSPSQALSDVGGKPSESELERLVEYYPTYKLAHRKQFLKALFDGESHEDLVRRKMADKGLVESASKQSKGGHGRWVVAKGRRTVLRILYLRYRLDKGLTRRQANQILRKKFSGESPYADVIGPSSISKATYSVRLDHPVKS